MIQRSAVKFIHSLAEQFPAILILGPRQCGKTTLAKHYLRGEYFDLERPSDYEIFADNIEFAISQFKGPLIFDEAQMMPDLFPVLRSLIDQKRNQNGRFYVLGSVNPALIRNISESLAGRVGILELTPFLYPEVRSTGIDLQTYWLRGGYADALKEDRAARWKLWQENYVRTFIERDIPRQNVKISSIQMRRLFTMIAHQHGGILNSSELGRSLGISYHTVNDYLDIQEGHYLIRRLQPYHPTIKKRIVKSPKVYIRDNGVLHYLLGISSVRNLQESPKRGNSWESLLIEQLIAMEQLRNIGSQFFYYRTHAGAEIDLIVDRGEEKIGYEFKCAMSAGKKDSLNLKNGIEEGIIHKGFLVYLGERKYEIMQDLVVINAEEILI
ncbi:MAG: hypothetical protein A2161_21025 [Candidatus Schekmanbacteria bacterium RBG_13_48_7]|uniref:AAA family ATPase n=1 Tax=Candidatus Schekmanbacteria bacterium RBG_13_48_7 TaxID=1817878 RepID=A0A1F7RR19_9BACT|nr:MAG: hypothetical protein A2161_21025 [Candidatus Schekmanbacteria bacterium RBG_13_48_7]